MITGYSKNLSVQILIDLLYKHGITRAVVSPGTTNLEFVAGLEYNGNFEMFSCIDERSAAYMACGIAEETGKPVIISCTEATASRNYFPALTEAFYRKLPIVAVTGVHGYNLVGTLFPQVIDRSISPNDICIRKVQLPVIKDDADIEQTELMVNDVLLRVKCNDKGPVHIDLPCCNDKYDFSEEKLYDARMVEMFESNDVLPALPDGRIAVYIGSNMKFSKAQTKLIDDFCADYDAVVFCDHTSGYKGKYAFHAGILSSQPRKYPIFDIKCLIHLGEQMADWPTMTKLHCVKDVWRVSPDGELRDTFGKLSKVFNMPIELFFGRYTTNTNQHEEYLNECLSTKQSVKLPIDKLPLSNVYVASKMSALLPVGSVMHLGASNTLRSWSWFDLPEGVESYGNVGCRGIDGVISSAVGGALIHPEQIHFCAIGDLMFFYDMNSLGNRDLKDNLRILLINNNGGGIFKLSVAAGYKFFGDDSTDKYIAAANHFGGKEKQVVRHYVESLGFMYMSARTKEEFDDKIAFFTKNETLGSSVLFEVFTKDSDDREAFRIMSSIQDDYSGARGVVKQILGEKGTNIVRDLLKK